MAQYRKKGGIKMNDKKEEIFIVGKYNLNPIKDERIPHIEIIMDTSGGRSDGEIVLFKQIAKEDNEYYFNKIKKE